MPPPPPRSNKTETEQSFTSETNYADQNTGYTQPPPPANRGRVQPPPPTGGRRAPPPRR